MQTVGRLPDQVRTSVMAARLVVQQPVIAQPAMERPMVAQSPLP
jgi:hypothetical protein